MGRFDIPLLIFGIIAILFLLGAGYIMGDNMNSSYLHQDNITRLSNLASYYYQNHNYTLENGYVCLDMAMDFWDIANAHNMNARIIVGNRTKMPENIVNADHAWVLVEVEPDNWVPVEVVNGTVMTGGNTYYHGWVFNSPKEVKDFLDQFDVMMAYWDSFIAASGAYNEKANAYNNVISKSDNRADVEQLSQELRDLKLVADHEEMLFNQSQERLGEYEAGLPKILGMATV